MSGDAMKLVKFVCVAPAHADARSEAALTIHDGVWAFCPKGADATGHEWQASDGLPIADALRFTPREPVQQPVPATPVLSAPAPAASRSKARPR